VPDFLVKSHSGICGAGARKAYALYIFKAFIVFEAMGSLISVEEDAFQVVGLL
jgi:hypothetical protein